MMLVGRTGDEEGAEVAYQRLPDLGVVFAGVEPDARRAISGFVTEVLAAA